MIEHLYYASAFFKLALGLYVLALLAYLLAFFRGKGGSRAAYALFGLAFLTLTVLIAWQWVEAARPPFPTEYESLIGSVWGVSLLGLWAERRSGLSALGLLSVFGATGILFLAAANRDVEVLSQSPAFQTGLFLPYAISYCLAYGALFVAGMSAALYLLFPQGLREDATLGETDRMELIPISSKMLRFGFVCLSVGLLLGAWWGQEAWGNYWSWGPRETGTLVSWLIVAACLYLLHTPLVSRDRMAWLILAGLVALTITHLGTDYLPTAENSLPVRFSSGSSSG